MGPAGPPGEAPSEEEIAEIVEEAVEEHETPEVVDTSELEDAIAKRSQTAVATLTDDLENAGGRPDDRRWRFWAGRRGRRVRQRPGRVMATKIAGQLECKTYDDNKRQVG